MKIDKKLIKELVENLKEFNLSELEYQDGETKIKVSKAQKNIEAPKASAVVPQNKAVLKDSDETIGTRIKSPIIGTAYLAPEPGASFLQPSLPSGAPQRRWRCRSALARLQCECPPAWDSQRQPADQ